MSTLLLIDCVSKDDRLNPYERIQRIGGPNTPDAPAPDGIEAHGRSSKTRARGQ